MSDTGLDTVGKMPATMELRVALPVTIRPLTQADLTNLEWDSDRVLKPQYVRAALEDRRQALVFLAALVNGSPVGRLGVDFRRRAHERVVVLWSFAVMPSLQRLGIGTALVREAERLVRERAGEDAVMEIGVEDWNHDARRLYERLGYRHAGEERGSRGERILLLRRPLADAVA